MSRRLKRPKLIFVDQGRDKLVRIFTENGTELTNLLAVKVDYGTVSTIRHDGVVSQGSLDNNPATVYLTLDGYDVVVTNRRPKKA